MEAKTDTAADLLRLKASEELLLASRRNDKAEIDRALANLDKACGNNGAETAKTKGGNHG